VKFNLIVFVLLSFACGKDEKVEYKDVPQAPRVKPRPPAKPPLPPNRGTLTPGPGKGGETFPPKPEPVPKPKPEPQPKPKPEPKPKPKPPPKPKPKPVPKMPELGEHKHNYYWQKDWGHWSRWPWCTKIPSKFWVKHNHYWAHLPDQLDWCKRHRIYIVDNGCMCRIP
jgi:hypothetical protein